MSNITTPSTSATSGDSYSTSDIDTSTQSIVKQPSTSEQNGIGALGINGSSIIFQIINFIILYVILSKFLFKPIAKILEQRRQTIEGGLIKAHEIDVEKESWENKHRALIENAKKESYALITDAKKIIYEQKQKIIRETKSEQEILRRFFSKKNLTNLRTCKSRYTPPRTTENKRRQTFLQPLKILIYDFHKYAQKNTFN